MNLDKLNKIDKFKIIPRAEFVYHYALFLLKRARQDNIKVPAGYLAYVTLLSLVPLTAIVFYILSAFPMFNDLQNTIGKIVYADFGTSSAVLIKNHIAGFLVNIKKMTMMGIVSLVAIALLLISAIDDSINRIWRNTKKRNFIYSIVLYWTILSFSPILAGSSIALSSFLITSMKTHAIGSGSAHVLSFLPFIFTWFAFTSVYTIIPRQKVSVRYALIGGFIASLLFSLGTKLFSLYLIHFPTQQMIYGALAILPILFIWVYFNWYIVLAGAIVTATIEEYIELHYMKKYQLQIDEGLLNDSDDPTGY
ncbi:MAG: virulence factor BrkB family protein [Psychromonas sp.]|nr:virulence factor BrkB family protein [Psychromonas sp.]